ncbi:S9 family peptidase [Streptomyces sp. NPDC047072]|uniref:S9 family peptidase n=1 Tax=Streptomyces sp. NPDC047072 TaxID=3154809 RepID=UPI0033D616D4
MVDAPAFLRPFLTEPRLSGLTLAPDGTRLVATVDVLDEQGAGYVPELWEVDPSGEREARPVAGTAQGDAAPAFAADGTLLFRSDRGESDGPAVWALSRGGEPEPVARHPGGISAFAAGGPSGTLAYTAALLPGAVDAESHGELLEARRRAKLSAILYEDTETRGYGGDLGPAEPHTFVQRADASVDAGGQGLAGEGDMALSPDGTTVAYTRAPSFDAPDTNVAVLADATSGTERRTFSRPGYQYYRPAFTADGSALICERQREQTYDTAWEVTLVALDPDTGAETDLLPDFDNWPWPGRAVPSPVPGDATLWFTGDEQGHTPVFRREPDGTITRLTASGAYSTLCVSPDGNTLYALRGHIDSPSRVVRLDATEPDQQPVYLKAPGALPEVPGTLTEVHTVADDGCPLRGWLVLPEGASAERPAPLVVMVHGGPQGSWSGWSWLWNPWLFADRGYAVLLPDPALSSGYGQRMQERSLDGYGGRPYDDVIALTDTALARADLDATRTALAGWSYGGYLANRTATRTDRFRAIVSHAGIWNVDTFQTDTYMHAYYRKIYGDPRGERERYDADSPHRDAAKLSTPMLLVHGGQDSPVPLAQSRALHHELLRRGVPVKFLLFQDEGHWIGAPNHVHVLYETVLAFLDQYVLGQEWRRPELL